jgi:SAM-dependent methyltransferase
VIATDLSGELLEMLARYLRHEGAGEEVVCIVMDAMSAHVSPGQFDLVTGASILHHLERPEDGIEAAGRALKPGGKAIFFEPFNGWSLMRLAYERILAEAEFRRQSLAPPVDAYLRAMVLDIAARSSPDPETPAFAALDDKWLFSRTRIEAAARAAGFAEIQFVPHNDHDTLFQDVSTIQLRLATGRADLVLPNWAVSILREYDSALTSHAKRELMLEGTIVLTMPRRVSRRFGGCR